MSIVAGVDLGGTAINYTLADLDGRFLIEGLCEHPARAVEGPEVCLGQIVEGLRDRRGGRRASVRRTSWPSGSTRRDRPAPTAC